MSVSTIFLIAFIVVVVVDVLLGVFRGAKFSLLRLLFYVIGTVVSALLAKTVTIKVLLKILESEVGHGDSIYSNIFYLIKDNAQKETADMFGATASGISLSAAIPFVFVALFIVFKLITWLLYFIVKLVIKKKAKKAVKARNQAATVDVTAGGDGNAVYMTGEFPDELVNPEPALEAAAEAVATEAAVAAEEIQTEAVAFAEEVQTEAVAAVEEVQTEAAVVAEEVQSAAVEAPEAVATEAVAFADEVQTEASAVAEEVQSVAVEAPAAVATEAIAVAEEVQTEAVEAVEEVQTEAVEAVEEVQTEAVEAVEEVQTEAVEATEEVQDLSAVEAAEVAAAVQNEVDAAAEELQNMAAAEEVQYVAAEEVQTEAYAAEEAQTESYAAEQVQTEAYAAEEAQTESYAAEQVQTEAVENVQDIQYPAEQDNSEMLPTEAENAETLPAEAETAENLPAEQTAVTEPVPQQPAEKTAYKKTWAEGFTEKSALSRIIGGLIGLIMALLGFAIIISPVKKLMTIADENSSVEAIIEILEILDDTDFDTVLDDVMAFDTTVKSKPVDSEIGFLDDLDGDKIIADYTSIRDSVPMYACKYTGADAVAGALYDWIEPAFEKDIYGDNEKKKESAGDISDYRFSVAFKEILGIIPDVKKAAELLHDNRLISVEMVDSLENIVLYALNNREGFTYIENTDKRKLINDSIDSIQEIINTELDLGGYEIEIKKIESVSQVRDGAKETFNLLRKVIRLFEDNFDKIQSLQNITDLSESLADADKLQDALEAVAEIDFEGAPEMISDFANEQIRILTDGEIQTALNMNGFRYVMSDKVLAKKASESVSRLASYGDRDLATLSESEKMQIMDDAGELYLMGVVTYEVYDYFLDMTGSY